MSIDLNQMLSAFEAGNLEARAKFPAVMGRHLKGRAKALAPDLVERSLTDDVVSRTWELLLSKGPGSYNPERSGAVTYINTVLRTAVRDVRSTSQTVVRTPRDYSTIELHPTEPTELASDGGIFAVDDAIDMESRLATLASRARVAARMIAYDGTPFVSAAARVGLSRFALKRQLISWATAAA